MKPQQPIILIKKKKVHHHAQHGGAWKVAYADFVTAMMALFIVLWLMNTTPQIRKMVAGYFNDPMGKAAVTGTDRSGSTDNLPVTRNNIADLKARLQATIRQDNDLKILDKQIEITVAPEGLRIELMESKNGTFFDNGSAALSVSGKELLILLAAQLGTVPNRISIDGHTDAKPFQSAAIYSNWELSVDRANAARRLMQANGLRANQVSQVRGYADQQLRLPNDPFNPSNRRITVIVQYLQGKPAATASSAK